MKFSCNKYRDRFRNERGRFVETLKEAPPVLILTFVQRINAYRDLLIVCFLKRRL